MTPATDGPEPDLRHPSEVVHPAEPSSEERPAVGARPGLEDLPEARICGKCGRRVFTFSDHCPRPCGGLLPGHRESLKHGKHARRALRERRLAFLEQLRAPHRKGDGTLSPEVDGVLGALAGAYALAERAIEYSEGCALALTDPKQQRAIKVFMEASDRIARHTLALGTLAGDGAGEPPPFVTKVTFGGRHRPPQSVPALEFVEDDDDPNLMQKIETREGCADLEVRAVRTRGEMLEALGRAGDEYEDDPEIPPLNPESWRLGALRRSRGHLRAWSRGK